MDNCGGLFSNYKRSQHRGKVSAGVQTIDAQEKLSLLCVAPWQTEAKLKISGNAMQIAGAEELTHGFFC